MNELLDEKTLTNLSLMLVDLLAGDESILTRTEYQTLSVESIGTALNFLLNNDDLDDKQKAFLLSNSWKINYRDRPPTPQNFISEKYLGPAAIHTYDRIKDTFEHFLDPSKPFRNLVLYPHISWGKSYLSTLITLYIGVHLSMMRNPYKFFGLNPATVLAQLLVSYSIKKSSEVLLEPMMAILETSPFFEKVHTRESMAKKERDFARMNAIDRVFWTTASPTSQIQMSNGANIKTASSPSSLLGLSVVSGVLSELAFFRDAGKDDAYIMRVFNDLKTRVDTRMKGNYFGRTILDSSPNTLDSPIDDYVVNHAHKDPTNLIIKGSVWEWAPEEYDNNRKFAVYTGGKGQIPRILFDDNERAGLSPEKVIEVPVQLQQFFKDDIYKALKDLAGIPSGSADSLIYDYEKIERIFNEKLRNVYTHITARSEDNPKRLIWDQVSHLFFKQKAGHTEFWYKPHLPRCVAIDQSLAHDVSCIAAAHVERIPESDEHMFVIDFTIPIAPMGGRINLDAIKFFIEDLRNLGNMYVSHVSFDQFQSEASIQYLKAVNFDTEKLSVDSTTDPYFNLISLIETGRVVAGRNLYIKNNLKSLRAVRQGKNGKTKKVKVDHDTTRAVVTSGDQRWETSLIGAYAKDATDAIAAAIELNRIHHPIALDTWDPAYLDVLLDSSAEKANAEKKLSALLQNMSLV